MTASSSSSSSAFDKLMRPSEDAERRVLGWDGAGEDVDVDEDGWMNSGGLLCHRSGSRRGCGGVRRDFVDPCETNHVVEDLSMF